jgi:hypothetical protein
MRKLLKAILSLVLAILMIMPIAAQASAQQAAIRQVVFTQAAAPHRTGGTLGRTSLGTASVGNVTMDGVAYANSISYSVSANSRRTGSAFSEHNLGGQQATLSGYIGRVGGNPVNATIRFYTVNRLGIGRLIQSHTIRSRSAPQRIYVDVRGVETLRISVTSAETNAITGVAATYAFAQGQLCNDMEAAAQRFRTNPWGYILTIGGLVVAVFGMLLSLLIVGDTVDPWRGGFVIAFGGVIAVVAGVSILFGAR